jgi:hypothetical protein
MKNLKFFIKRFFKIYFLFILIMAIVGYLAVIRNYHWPFEDKAKISDRRVLVKKTSKSDSPYQLMWWAIKDEKMYLNLKDIEDNRAPKIYELNSANPKNIVTKKLVMKDNIGIPNDMSFGSFNSTLDTFKADLDNDGKKENVNLSAKVDTRYTQAYLVNTTTFNSKQVPMEVNQLEFLKFGVLYNGRPLVNKKVRLISASGLDKNVMLNKDGTFKLNNLKYLTSGLIVIYKEKDNLNITNYMIERNRLFTKRHLSVLEPLIFIFIVSIGIILLTIFLRFILFRRKPLFMEELRN